MTETGRPSRRSKALSEAGASPEAEKASAEKLSQIKQAAESQIDAFMRKVGYANPAERTDERGWRWFNLGSAEGRAAVIESDGELYLAAEAPIMQLPSDKELILPLMRELLEMNTVLSGTVRLGIKNEWVVATATRMVADLGGNDCAACINAVMRMADNLDDPLLAKYGGTSQPRVAPKA